MIKSLFTAATLSVFALALSGTATGNSPTKAQATFSNASGEQIGAASLTETPAGVLINVQLSDVPTGEHGFHIHETGRCDAPDFKSAGGHYNPAGVKHGYMAGEAIHAGDMPNQFVQDDGVLRAHILNPNVSLSQGEASLFDDDGSAIIIHAKADDYRSQPSGDAGQRIACAVIQPN